MGIPHHQAQDLIQCAPSLIHHLAVKGLMGGSLPLPVPAGSLKEPVRYGNGLAAAHADDADAAFHSCRGNGADGICLLLRIYLTSYKKEPSQ